MLKSILSITILATALFAVAPSANAQIKIGTLDMNAIFTQYYKTKDAEAKLNEARAAAKKKLLSRFPPASAGGTFRFPSSPGSMAAPFYGLSPSTGLSPPWLHACAPPELH